MNVAQETLGFRRQGLSPCLSLLMSAFALPIPPADLSIHLHRPRERSSTTRNTPSIPLRPCRLNGVATRPRERTAIHQRPKLCDLIAPFAFPLIQINVPNLP